MLRGLWTWLVLVVATMACGIPALLVDAVRPRSDAVMRAGRLWSRTMLAASGARVEYVGLERAAGAEPRVFIANHQSFVDIWALIRVLPANARFVAKHELRRVPVMGWAMAVSGFVFIDRANRTRAIQSLRAAAARIRGGRSVVLFAEGTRTRDGRLQPFKKGPFHLAVEAGVPIVPVAISGSWRVLRPGTLAVRPGRVRVEFLAPLDPGDYARGDLDGLRQRVHALLRERIEPAGAAAT